MDNNSTSPQNCKPDDFKSFYGMSPFELIARFGLYKETLHVIMQNDFHGKVYWNKRNTKMVTINISIGLITYLQHLMPFVAAYNIPNKKVKHGDVVTTPEDISAYFSFREVISYNQQLTAIGLLKIIRVTGTRRLNYKYFTENLRNIMEDEIVLKVDRAKFSRKLPRWSCPD